MLERDGDAVRAAVDIRPYASDDGASGWVVSDLIAQGSTPTVRPMRPDFVLGVSSASTTLAQLTVRRPVGRALDLGTGCGVQSLHLARHADQVVATDLNPRALALAAADRGAQRASTSTCALGSLYDPVAGETFDLITTNPPYVMSPPAATTSGSTYREGSWTADGLVEQVVRDGAAHLAEGGTLQVLANWAHVAGQDWTERMGGWIAGSGCDAHVVQREVLDVARVRRALAGRRRAGRLAGLPGRATPSGWTTSRPGHRGGRDGLAAAAPGRPGGAARAARGLALRRRAAARPRRSERELVAVGLERSLTDEALLARRWVLAGDVVEETTGVPGEADPQHLVLRQQRGFRRATEPDTALAGVLGACDGELALGTDRRHGGRAARRRRGRPDRRGGAGGAPAGGRRLPVLTPRAPRRGGGGRDAGRGGLRGGGGLRS